MAIYTHTFSATPLYGDDSRQLLNNPDRGFRLETLIDVAKAFGANTTKADVSKALRPVLERAREESPRVLQAYFYLTGYRDRDLDELAFANMQAYIDCCRDLSLQILLRFAYIANDQNKDNEDAETSQILRHITQLKPFLIKNRDVLFCLQAGFIGPWGEWSGGSPQDRGTILNFLMNNVPEDLFVMVRYVPVKNTLDTENPLRSMVGYHDDYLVGEPHQWNTGNWPDSLEYQQLDRETPYVLVDGEMPWGGDRCHIDGIKMAKRLARHHFSLLSMDHNYRECGEEYSIVEWKKQMVDEAVLKENGLPFDPAWLLNCDGRSISRSVFEYIRDYLGYYITVSDGQFTIDGQEHTVSFTLTNHGFAAPLAMKSCELVLVDSDGQTVAAQSACELAALQTNVPVACTVRLTTPFAITGWQIGIALKNYAGTGARLANNLPFENGVNYLHR